MPAEITPPLAAFLPPPLPPPHARAKPFLQDKEQLYDEAMRSKQNMNTYKDENTKLKTRIQQCAKEIDKKDKVIQELSSQLNNQQTLTQSKGRQIAEAHLTMALKKQVKDMKEDLRIREEEAKSLKQGLKVGRMKEMELELKSHEDECANLKLMIVNLVKQQPMSISPGDAAALEGRIREQDALLANLKQENFDLAATLQKHGDELENWKESAVQLEKKVAKLESTCKDSVKNKKIIADNKKEIEKLREQVSLLKVDNKDKEAATYRTRINDLIRKQSEVSDKIAQRDKAIKDLEARVAKVVSPAKEAQQLNEIRALKIKISSCTFPST